MIESVITLLIYIVLIAIIIYLVLWVLEQIGLSPPPKVIQLLWVIGVLVVLLVFSRMFLPMIGHVR